MRNQTTPHINPLPKRVKAQAIAAREFTRLYFSGHLLDDTPTPRAPAPATPTLPRYPGVLARCWNGSLVFARPVPVQYQHSR